MNYIILYADDYDCDAWEEYCDACGVSYDEAYIKVKFNINDVESGE